MRTHGNGHGTLRVVVRDSRAPFLEWQLHSLQLLWILCLPLLSSEYSPAHLTFLVSSLELGSSGLPVSAYLFTEPSPWPILCDHLWLGDKNCVFNSYYGVWGTSSHLNVPVSVSLSHGGVWSSANPHRSETSETYFF